MYFQNIEFTSWSHHYWTSECALYIVLCHCFSICHKYHDQMRGATNTNYSSRCGINQTSVYNELYIIGFDFYSHQESIDCIISFIIYNLYPSMFDWLYNQRRTQSHFWFDHVYLYPMPLVQRTTPSSVSILVLLWCLTSVVIYLLWRARVRNMYSGYA